MAQKLSLASLPNLPESVSAPDYLRTDLTAGILHIGVGNFHRAHQARYLDALFAQGRDHDWAIVGAGVMPFDTQRRTELKAQNWLSMIVEMGPKKMKASVTGSMIDFCETNAKAIIDRIANPSIRIISLTITEGGYYIDARTNHFDNTHADILHDSQNLKNPRTIFGIILAGLVLRRSQGNLPPTVLSCDNIPANGGVTRQALLGLAALISEDLKTWVSDHVSFPNSIVDRITPATSAETREMVLDEFKVEDAAPVVCEPFMQWVMEDKFPLGRPALELVGVQFVSDIAAYETMKLRILNAGHAALAYPAALMGYEYVHDALTDNDIMRWLKHLIGSQVIPVLKPISDVDYYDYLVGCIERFKNPAMRDTIARLCQDGSNRQPKFILPTITEALNKGLPIDGLALELALWCRYCTVVETLDDPRAAALLKAANESPQNPSAFLSLTEIFGNLGDNENFSGCFERHITALWKTDPRIVLQQYLNENTEQT